MSFHIIPVVRPTKKHISSLSLFTALIWVQMLMEKSKKVILYPRRLREVFAVGAGLIIGVK